jgi:hypothetical protein
MRVCTYTWPFPFGVRLGWATARTPNPDPSQARGRVYLLRGNGIIFSRGLGVICRQLRDRGIWAEDLRCVGDLWAYRHLVADHRAGRLHGPVVFVGHSCGARYSLYAAHKLHKLGLGIDLVVCLDVAVPPEVPPNVKKAVNIYMNRRRLYPARPLRAMCPAATAVVNIDLACAASPVNSAWLTHLNIVEPVAVRHMILGHVLEAIEGATRPTPQALAPNGLLLGDA